MNFPEPSRTPEIKFAINQIIDTIPVESFARINSAPLPTGLIISAIKNPIVNGLNQSQNHIQDITSEKLIRNPKLKIALKNAQNSVP